jgi:hypothetical protein
MKQLANAETTAYTAQTTTTFFYIPFVYCSACSVSPQSLLVVSFFRTEQSA